MAVAEPRRRPRVLVVDDEESVRKLVERALGRADYDVVVASSGDGALRVVAEQGPFDLYIVDFMMPGMRGDELARELRAAQPAAEVLFFTGQGESLLERRGVLSQPEKFLDKPLSLDALRQAVSRTVYGQARPPR